MCLSLKEHAENCRFGSQCRFLHDVGEYMAVKPADLGDSCVLFQTFGKCIYGVTCRFAKTHLGEDYRNLVNEDLVKQWEGKSQVRNNLSKELQQQLRKKKVCFEKANKYLCHLAKAGSKGGNKATSGSAGEKGVTNCTASRSSPESVGLKHHGEEAQDLQVPTEGGDAPKPVAPQSPRPTSESENSAVKTIGSVTDEDIVKLRPCEKKKVSATAGAGVPAMGAALVQVDVGSCWGLLDSSQSGLKHLSLGV